MKNKKLFTLILVFLITVGGVSFNVLNKKQDICRNIKVNETMSFNDVVSYVKSRDGYYINTAVLHIEDEDNYTAETTIEYLKQSTTIGLNVSNINLLKDVPSFDNFDILYLDESLKKNNDPKLIEKIISFVEKGGYVFVANNLYDIFPKDFIGAKDYKKIVSAPIKINIPKFDIEFRQIQELILDFSIFYKDYTSKDFLFKQDYGMAVVPSSAEVLAESKGQAIYTINKYGKGRVFYTNPLLPNKFSKSSFSLKESKQEQGPFSNTTASFNQMLYGYFASYVSKQIYGFSIQRVFGSYASPIMGWSLHYENIPGIKENGLKNFGELVEENNQIPSFSLVRNALTWNTRTETAAYILNEAKNRKDLTYNINLYENPFGGGTYIASDDKWIQLKTKENMPSGITSDINNRTLFYPHFIDYDKDGLLDAFTGSSDGKIYYFKNLGFTGKDGRLVMERSKPLEASVEEFSAPQLLDVDGDDVLDIISGSKNGNIYYFKGLGNFSFAQKELLIKTDIQGCSFPAIGDLNADGTMDIVVGSDSGVILIYYGEKEGKRLIYSHNKMRALSRQCADLNFGKYLSPFVVDYNKDGYPDVILGTQDGYIAKLKGSKTGEYSFEGYIQTKEMNIKGNNNLKFGLFSNPRLIDINKDGKLDVVVGYEDIDLPYPIDSVYFPYRNQYKEQMDFAKSKNYYLGMHYFSGWYASKEREKYEIRTHFNALKYFGIKGKIGVNQHGGPVTRLSEKDSYRTLFNEGVLWESFFESKEHAFANWIAAETAVVNPFFIVDEGKRTILVQNVQSAIPCSGGMLPCSRDNVNVAMKYAYPVLNYHHPDDRNKDLSIQIMNNLEKYRKKFEYNFVKEDQMMKAIAAAYNLKVNLDVNGNVIEITPDIEDNKFPLYDKNAQSAAGIKIEFSHNLKDVVSTDSSVWRKKDNNLYVGLDKKVSVFIDKNKDNPHLIRVNIPAKIRVNEKGVSLLFLDDGMMQASVTGFAGTDSSDWKAEYKDGITTFTKFGSKERLNIVFGEQG